MVDEGGVKVFGDEVLRYFWYGISEISILTSGICSSIRLSGFQNVMLILLIATKKNDVLSSFSGYLSLKTSKKSRKALTK